MLKQEIVELLRTVLSFESHVEADREKLFTQFAITDAHIWNFVFGADLSKANRGHLFIFVSKNNANITREECQLLCQRYSTFGDGTIDRNDFWEIFYPKNVPMAEEILRTRKKKNVVPQLIELHYKAKELIINILEKTIEFEKSADEMRNNISDLHSQFDSFVLPKVNAASLQIFMHENDAKSVSKKNCETILQHILGFKKNREKHFHCFLFKEVNVAKCNPIAKLTPSQCEQLTSPESSKLPLFFESKKVEDYGKKYKKHSAPLFLLYTR